MAVPALTEATGWRAAYWSAAALAVAAAVPVLAMRELPRVGHSAERVLRDPRLLPLGFLQAATFGLAVVAGNWVVPLLERSGASPEAAGLVGGLVLFAGILTRPGGGWLAERAGRRKIVVWAIFGVAAGAALLAAGGPLWLSATGSLLLGLGAGLPFATIFAAAQRLRPDAPGAAVAVVNATAIAAILLGTPLAGLAFDLPGDGRAAFAAIALLAAAALLALHRARLDGR